MAGYGTDEGLTAYMTANGLDMPSGTPAPAILRLRASDYIDGLYEARFVGERTDPLGQERAWPRTGAKVGKIEVPVDMVPPAIERAAYAAAVYEAQNPGGLAVSASASSQIKRDKLGPMETEFFAGTGNVVADATVRLSAVEGALAPYLRQEDTGTGFGLWSVG